MATDAKKQAAPISLEALVSKRHSGDAWIIFHELGNSTGYNTKRHADMVALGVWPSRGYEIHGYEIKRSRSDVQKEIDDPSKADAVGRYCDFWWLVIEDEKIIDGLIIPKTWGILAPKNQVLRVVRKAPQQKAEPVNRGFCAAMIRNATANWIPRATHNEVIERLYQEKLAKQREVAALPEDAKQAIAELAKLRKCVAEFEERSGVEINRYQAGNIGDAVRLVHQARYELEDDAIKQRAVMLDGMVRQLEWAASNAKSAASVLRDLIGPKRDQRELPLEGIGSSEADADTVLRKFSEG